MSDTGVKAQIKTVTVHSRNREETFNLGKVFGETAPDTGTIALNGPLGAGKTLFVQGLALGLGIPSNTVNSPTYQLVHLHEGRLSLCHVDLYRLEGSEAFDGLGLEELFEAQGIAAIEWADKGLEVLPGARLDLSIDYAENDEREIVVRATDIGHQSWIDAAMKSGHFIQEKS